MAAGRKADYTAQIPQIWAKDLFAQAEHLTFWHRFEGPPGSSMPVIRRDELQDDPGDTIKVDIVMALTGAGVTGDTTLLEGNEEKMAMRQNSFSVDALAHAVRWSKLAEVLITKDMRTSAKNQLAKWLSGKLDDSIFSEFTGSGDATLPTTAKWFAGTATSIGTVADTDAGGRLKLNDISDAKAYAQVNNKIEPLRLENGEEVFGMVLHDYAALALKKDASYQQAQREAQARGADNPLFSGAVAMWDGVVLYTSRRVPTAADGSGSISVARNIFFGAQALLRGYAYYPKWTEQLFSYAQEAGIATWCVYGDKLNVFDLTSGGGAAAANYTALGSIVVYSSAVAPTA